MEVASGEGPFPGDRNLCEGQCVVMSAAKCKPHHVNQLFAVQRYTCSLRSE